MVRRIRTGGFVRRSVRLLSICIPQGCWDAMRSREYDMRQQYLLMIVALMAFSGRSFAADDLMKSAQGQFKVIPSTAPTLPGNPATPATLELGKMLYFDPRLSASHAISCNSCHNTGLGGADAQET